MVGNLFGTLMISILDLPMIAIFSKKALAANDLLNEHIVFSHASLNTILCCRVNYLGEEFGRFFLEVLWSERHKGASLRLSLKL